MASFVLNIFEDDARAGSAHSVHTAKQNATHQAAERKIGHTAILGSYVELDAVAVILWKRQNNCRIMREN